MRCFSLHATGIGKARCTRLLFALFSFPSAYRVVFAFQTPFMDIRYLCCFCFSDLCWTKSGRTTSQWTCTLTCGHAIVLSHPTHSMNSFPPFNGGDSKMKTQCSVFLFLLERKQFKTCCCAATTTTCWTRDFSPICEDEKGGVCVLTQLCFICRHVTWKISK